MNQFPDLESFTQSGLTVSYQRVWLNCYLLESLEDFGGFDDIREEKSLLQQLFFSNELVWTG
jgi:hypothetical protein